MPQISYKGFALELARNAGKVIKTNFTLGMGKKWKADNTPVVETDIAVNQLVIQEVQKHFPKHGILGEEQSQFSGQQGVWVVDPLDGTIPFSHGIPVAVFSIAYVYDGEVQLGVIYDPFMDRMFFAEKGKGAFLNEQKIHVSSAANIQNTVINIEELSGRLAGLFGKLKPLAKVVTIGSCSYAGTLVACGEFVGEISTVKGPHDTAAIKVIVEEAGGKVTDLAGNEQRYDQETNGHIVSNSLLHDELLTLIQETVQP